VDEFVDPTLHRNRVDWDDLESPVPAALRDVVDTAWVRLQALAGPQGDEPATLAALDDSRAAYAELYAGAEALAHSSLRARAQPPSAPPTFYLQLARRIPPRYRKLIRRALRA
jgi:2-polyprenyl-6-methoxyphenol hydroxylase-like FAD-dependent oxidoreductase